MSYYIYDTIGIPGPDKKLPDILSLSANNGTVYGGDTISIGLYSKYSSGHTITIGGVSESIIYESISAGFGTITFVTSGGSAGYKDISILDSDLNSATISKAWLYISPSASSIIYYLRGVKVSDGGYISWQSSTADDSEAPESIVSGSLTILQKIG